MNYTPPHSILVVDDEPSVITFIRTVLFEEGFDIFSACDLQGGLEALASEPSLVIVDLGLGCESGIPLIRQAAGCVPRPGIIAISGSGPGALDQAVRAGADHAIDKPFSPNLLRTAVSELGMRAGGVRKAPGSMRLGRSTQREPSAA